MMNRKTNGKRFKVRGSTSSVARSTSQSGFTLVELLISSVLTLLVLGAIYSVYRMQIHTVKAQERRLEAQEYGRAVLDLMVREIRNAGYDPRGSGCGATPTADIQSFRFLYDANANNDCVDADENITYAFSDCGGGLGDITRNDGTGAVALTDCNVSSFSLKYFRQDGIELTAVPLSAADRLLIQRVLITLTVQSKNPDGEYGGGQLNASMNSNAELRNRGLPP